jgi:uncharacterized membrane protein HdeD (DUF308 family)
MGGIYFLTHPVLAIGTSALLLAVVILRGGVLEITFYFPVHWICSTEWSLW